MHFSMGKKTPKNCPFPLDFITPLEEGQAMVIGNMHKRFRKDHACGLGDMLADTQTDTQMCSLQCFATAAASELTN